MLRVCAMWKNSMPKLVFHEKDLHFYLPNWEVTCLFQLVWLDHWWGLFYVHDAWNMRQLSPLPRSCPLLACNRALKSDSWLAQVHVVAQFRCFAMPKISWLCTSLAIAIIKKKLDLFLPSGPYYVYDVVLSRFLPSRFSNLALIPCWINNDKLTHIEAGVRNVFTFTDLCIKGFAY